ncbi:MAG: molybdopterin molybdenumtransferase MoeA, partial [Acidobacteriia bacterium]|nr:molybdopterin molybdenumtransferase MoeA [Terriglobia bacterium]
MSFSEARETVMREIRVSRELSETEVAPLCEAPGRVLAEDVAADRDSPPLARAMRDGYAVRALDLPGELEIVGEIRAGERFAGAVLQGQAVEIMTGAPVPEGADAVVMVEHTHRVNGRVTIGRAAEPQQNI